MIREWPEWILEGLAWLGLIGSVLGLLVVTWRLILVLL